MPGDPHDREVVNPGPAHVGHCGVPKVVKAEVLNAGAATGGLECPLGRLDGLPVDQKDMRLVQVPHLIQLFESGGQVSRPSLMGSSNLMGKPGASAG